MSYPVFRLSRPLPFTAPPLAGLLMLLHSAAASADTTELDTVVVSSSAQNAVHDIARPVTVLDRDAIDSNPGDTLGTLLESLPGVSNASFGPGVGRPVLRGMSGSRVRILQNGSDSADLSAMSSDHAPMAEASVAEQIEVIYGPATLLYGGGAIGGVVNLIDQRIHEQPAEGLSGDVSARTSSNDDGHSLDAMLNAGKGNWIMHADGFSRQADDYHSGNQDDAPAGNNAGTIANSDSKGSGGAVALSWADGNNGFLGGSISTLDYDYGVPNSEGEAYRVKPSQTRYDLKGGWRPAGSSIEEWRTELSYNDYEHDETDGSLVVGLFDQESYELRSSIRHQLAGRWGGTAGIQIKRQKLQLCHNHAGCDGIPSYPQLSWDGSMGTNFTTVSSDDGDLIFSHDTPMPTTTTTDAGLFMVEQRDWQAGTLELGARLDLRTIEADPDPIRPAARRDAGYYDDKNFRPLTLSAAGTWILSQQQRLGLTLARVQRAPDAQELYWNGDHHATFSFQLDNPDLDTETAWTLDLNWLYENDGNRLRIALYHYEFSDYIYNDLKSITDPFHSEPVYRHEQADARFSGSEISWQYRLSGHWSLDTGADIVRARLTSGDDLPRTPPASLLLALNWENNQWQARLENRNAMRQDKTATNETATDGYSLLNASISYRQPLAATEVIWRASAMNLTDEYAVNHVSYLKDAAPLPGRNIQLGINWRF